MKLASRLTFLSVFTLTVAAQAAEPKLLCQALPEQAVAAAKGAPVLVMQFAGSDEVFRMEGALASPKVDLKSPSTLGGVRMVSVQPDEIRKVCDAGYDVSVITMPNSLTPQSRQKGYLPPMTSVPSAFTIVGLWSQTWGNFWVPQTLPSGHTYQVVDFQVTPYNYATSGSFSHIGVSVLTRSDSNFQADFDGKGVSIGGGFTGCDAHSIGVEAWAIQNWSEANGCMPGPTCQAVVYAPSSCATWEDTQPRRFVVGANVNQQVQYWSCAIGGACPPPNPVIVNTTMSGYRSGGAGVAFIHVLGDTGSVWSLSFNAVNSYTSP